MPQGSIETLKKPPRMTAWSNLKRMKISPRCGGKSYLIVKLLLVGGADVESKSNNGQTPLRRGAKKRHETGVKFLLEKGTEVETKEQNNYPKATLWGATKRKEGGE